MEQNKKKALENLEDVKSLVDTFYGRIRADKLLAPIFNERIQDRWPEHLAKMYTFWQTLLLKEHTYYGAPFIPHANLDVFNRHFQQWLSLWHQTLDDLFIDCEAVKEARWRAERMAEMFEFKIAQRRAMGAFL